jgi:hypothetical protein
MYVCEGCGEAALHVEAVEGGGDPYGLPFELRWCECGGFLLVASDSTHPDVRRRGKDRRFH